MSQCLRIVSCPPSFVDTWKEWHITKCILFTVGILCTISGFYIACTLPFSEYGPYVVCSLFVGVAGVFTIACSVVLYLFRDQNLVERESRIRRRNARQARSEYFAVFQDRPPPYEFLQNVNDAQPSSSGLSITIDTAGTKVEVLKLRDQIVLKQSVNDKVNSKFTEEQVTES